jgi:hypothetical protein
MAASSRNRPVRLCFDQGTLRLEGAGRAEVEYVRRIARWRRDPRVGALRCDAIHYADVSRALADRLGERFQDDVPAPR